MTCQVKRAWIVSVERKEKYTDGEGYRIKGRRDYEEVPAVQIYKLGDRFTGYYFSDIYGCI